MIHDHQRDNTMNRPTYEEAINNLNSAQRKAVEAIEGPVMVIAGPGTGKTEILSLRIGNILQQTDSHAQNILCLTYTDAGTVAMRQRLLKYIGPDAYNVHIHTFHAFCNMVIQENLDYFGSFRDLKPISELEEVLLFNEFIDNFPVDHTFKRLTGFPYYDRLPMKQLFSTMKQEKWSSAYVLERINQYIDREREYGNYIYLRNTKDARKGDFNERKFEKDVLSKMKRLIAGAEEFDRFQDLLKKNERYDYHDMLRWVNDAFEVNPDLLADYQERYQYILVDEFQDTNGIQIDILNQLSSYWDQPNLFVVGDDDQAIYRFQGANMGNMNAFIEQYTPEVVVLTENYRSTQSILDAAMAMIDRNEERLTKKQVELNLSKILHAHKSTDAYPAPSILAYQNEAHELAGIAKMILQANDDPHRDMDEIAVIYRSHRQVADIVQALESNGIPLNIRRKVDVLKEPFIRNVIEVMQYISEENQGAYGEDQQLFRMMHFRFWNIEPTDIAHLLLDYQKKGKSEESFRTFRSFLSDEHEIKGASLKDEERVFKFIELLDQLQKDLNEVSLQSFFERLIYRSGIMEYALTSSDRSWKVQLITTLFNLIKDETDKRPELELKDFLETVETMHQNEVSLPVQKIIQAEHGVHFVTAHSAKGLEFREVYMMGCTSNKWESKRGGRNQFSFPDTLTSIQSDQSVEDERRLFYVGMTRAKEKLVISYASEDANGKSLEPSVFVTEVNQLGGVSIKPVTLSEDDIVSFYEKVFTQAESKVPMIDKALVDQILEKFELSVTSLNKYIECPRAFYYENILRVPSAKASHMGFGSAIHYALEQFFDLRFRKGKSQLDLFSMLNFFEKGMERNRAHFSLKEYEDRTIFGKQILTGYYENYHATWNQDAVYEFEFPVRHVEFAGFPIKGVLDKVIITGNNVQVVDYKTGKYENSTKKLNPPSPKSPDGGNYWRQIVFYKMLTLADQRHKWTMDEGVIDFVQPKKDGSYISKSFHVSQSDLDFVAEQMKDVYQKIQNYAFDEGCDDCDWCRLVNQHFVVQEVDSIPVLDED